MKSLPPLRLALAPGDVVYLSVQNQRYSAGPVTLRVVRVRGELAKYYDNQWVWLDGRPVSGDGTEGPVVQVLARVTALPGGVLGGAPGGTA